MKAWKLTGLATFGLILAVAAILLINQEPEPRHSGRPLSEWVEKLFATYPRRNPEAVHALRAMGEPAVQRLVELVEREDSRLVRELRGSLGDTPMISRFIPSKDWDRFTAVKALGEIGPNAASAVPALTKASAEGVWMGIAAKAALVLIRNEPIGDYISTSLNYGDPKTGEARGIVIQLGPHAKEGIPAYLEELESTNSRIRLHAMHVLAAICAESPECVPIFMKLLEHPDKSMRLNAIYGLYSMGESARPADRAVVELLDDPDDHCRFAALIFIEEVIPADEFQPFEARVRQATNDVDEEVRSLATRLLEQRTPK